MGISRGCVQLLASFPRGIPYLTPDIQGNILVNAQGQAVITDFGLAKVREEMNEVLERPSSVLGGSVRWMAPELFLSQVEDEQKIWITTFSDIYAFASVCLEVGRAPMIAVTALSEWYALYRF